MSSLEELVDLLARRISAAEALSRVRAVADAMGCRAHLIGSHAGGRAVQASDIDILVVYRELPASMLERGRMKAEILEKAGIPVEEDVHIELVGERDAWFYLERSAI
ncbi:MAG: nucleotidyltransferase domain-containing protein [Desulfurococcales archaeon]|nr:nucleotidyltransferase domain-containing protein [Desulfurococcales archaeon]